MSKIAQLEYEQRMSAEPKFAETYCSQCGQNLGPGDSGVSHCRDHMRLDQPRRGSSPKIGEQLGEQELKLRNFELNANATSKFLEWHAEVVKLAVLAEREACAVLVENYCGAWDDQGFALSQAIRARGQE